jgi:hypothetical protein
MASLVFKKTSLDLAQHLASLNYYADLVVMEPPNTAETRGDLSIASGGNYAPLPIVNVTASYEGLGAKCDCDDLIWDNLVIGGGNQVKGLVVCRGNVATPLMTDRIISFISVAPFTPNGIDFTFVFPSTGFFRTI